MKLSVSHVLMFPLLAAWAGWLCFEFIYLPWLQRGLHITLLVCLALGVISVLVCALTRRLNMPRLLALWSLAAVPLFALGFMAAAYLNIRLVESRFVAMSGRIDAAREIVLRRAKETGSFPSRSEDLDSSAFGPFKRTDFEYCPPQVTSEGVVPATLEFAYSGGAFRAQLATGLEENALPRWFWYDYLTGIRLEPNKSHICWLSWNRVPLDDCDIQDWSSQ